MREKKFTADFLPRKRKRRYNQRNFPNPQNDRRSQKNTYTAWLQTGQEKNYLQKAYSGGQSVTVNFVRQMRYNFPSYETRLYRRIID